RTDLEKFTSSGKSLMPEGLEKDLPKKDMTDLLAYLSSQKLPTKKFHGNQPAVVKLINDRFEFKATECEIYGKDIVFELPYFNIGMWHHAQDHVLWHYKLDKAQEFDVYLDYACDVSSEGNPFVLEGAEPPIHGKVTSTGTWANYRQIKIGTVALKQGEGSLT